MFRTAAKMNDSSISNNNENKGNNLSGLVSFCSFPAAVIFERKIIYFNKKFREFAFEKSGIKDITDPLDLVHNKSIHPFAGIIKELESGRQQNRIINFVPAQSSDGNEYSAFFSVLENIKNHILLQIFTEFPDEKDNNNKNLIKRIEKLSGSFSWCLNRRDGKFKTEFVTPGVEDLTGYTAGDFLSNNLLWIRLILPDDRKKITDFFSRIYNDPVIKEDKIECRIYDYFRNIIWVSNTISVERNNDGSVSRIFILARNITFEKLKEQELENEINRLTETNKKKDRFISIISHDLRSPFSSIIGYSNYLLENENISDNKKREYLNYISESAGTTLNLVNSLLEWTRLQTGRIKFEPAKINISEIFSKASEMLNGAAFEKNISIAPGYENEIYVKADKELILQVIINLISNAIKFTNSGGKITITAKPQPEENKYLFGVSDNGVGISKENLEKLFKIDEKFTSRGTKGEKGTGLGLSLCKDIIHKHNGKIWVESEPGKGSVFYFTLPVVSNQILLVNGQKTERILYRKLIQSLVSGYEIIEASDGYEALQIIKKHQPVLLLTEHFLEGMSGFQLVKHIALGNFEVKPGIIILSENINKTLKEEYQKMGIKSVFNKPVEINELKTSLNKLLLKS